MLATRTDLESKCVSCTLCYIFCVSFVYGDNSSRLGMDVRPSRLMLQLSQPKT